MEQKRFDKKNLVVILALAALIALVILAASVFKPEINPTLGVLSADATQTPVEATATPVPEADATQAPVEVTVTSVPEATAPVVQAYLVVQVAGAMYEPIPLYEEARYTITRGDMVNTIAVTPTGIRMHESSCDNQDCVLQGEVTLENHHKRVLQNMILCLPNEVIMELYTYEELLAAYPDWQGGQAQ